MTNQQSGLIPLASLCSTTLACTRSWRRSKEGFHRTSFSLEPFSISDQELELQSGWQHYHLFCKYLHLKKYDVSKVATLVLIKRLYKVISNTIIWASPPPSSILHLKISSKIYLNLRKSFPLTENYFLLSPRIEKFDFELPLDASKRQFHFSGQRWKFSGQWTRCLL